MNRFTRWLPYLAFLGLAFFFAQALLRPDSLCTDDAFYHINKAVVLENALRQGQLFPRWQPEMAWGFGYPHFNYYAPLGSYLLAGLHQLGLIYPAALNVLFIAGLWLAGVGAFWLGREWWGAAGGFLTGAAYQSAPYVAFNILFRGALAETLGLVVLPLVLFAFHRALTARRTGRFAVTRWDLAAAAALALLLYAHNATALGAAPLIAAYAALLALKQRAPGQLVRGGLLFAAGLALAARFWLPALGERSLVQSDRLLVPPIFTYYTNYISAGELLALPRVEDPLLLNPSPAKGLGLLAVSLAGLGALAGLWAARRRSETAWPSLFFLGALAGYAFLTLAVSRPLWDAVPLIAFLQFPWRLLSAGALCAALLIGANTLWWPRGANGIALGLLPVLALGQLGWWYPRVCAPMSEITLARTVQYERETGTIGSTAKGEFLPVTVHRFPFPEDASLADALRAGAPPPYLAGLPAGAGLTVFNAYPLNYTAALTLTAPAALTFKQFYFPGWWATLDGAPLEIKPDSVFGLITFTVPAGAHTLRLGFGDTPLRAAGDWITLLAAAALLAALCLTRPAAAEPAAAPLDGRWSAALLAAALLLNGLRVGLLDRGSNPLVRTAYDPVTGAVAGLGQTLNLVFTGGLRLAGYDLSARSLPSDGGVDAVLTASLAAPAARMLKPAYLLTDAAGQIWDDHNGLLPPRWFREPPPTFAWTPENYAQWAYRVLPLPGTPPGQYQLVVSFFDTATFETLSVLDDQGNAVTPRVDLGPLTVTRPAQPFKLQPETPAAAAFGPLTFLGYHLEAAQVQAGDPLDLTWYWRSTAAIPADWPARWELLDAAGQSVYGVDLEPANGYGTAQWQPGDEWRGQHRVVVPADLAGGQYQVAVSVPGQSGRQILKTLTVTAPPHTFTAPAFAQASGAQFAGVGTLAGYTLTRAAGQVTLTLIWQAAATPAQAYQVFVHLGAGEQIAAQSVSAPAGGLRATTGWVAGEYIEDPRTLTLPADLAAGSYEVRVGLFDPQSGARVPVTGPGAEADQRVLLTTLVIP